MDSSETITMWTSIKTTHAGILGRVACWLITGAVALHAALLATPGQAQPLEYVRICHSYGASFFYIPGTETCVNAQQVVDDQIAIARSISRAATGVAMAASLVDPFLPDGTNYAVSAHWAGFDGQHAAGFSGLMRLSGNLALSAGFAVGLDRGKLLTTAERKETEFGTAMVSESWSDIRVLGRVGLKYAW
jgi:hypothetical protein